jgi:arsenate reductase (glutaredoxin)
MNQEVGVTEERLTMYEKPTCTTCRSVAKILRENGVDFHQIDYTLDPIPRAKLEELVGKMGISPRELLRTREKAYGEMGLGEPGVTDDQVLDAMAHRPELVQRPILERGDRAVLARPAERAREIF